MVLMVVTAPQVIHDPLGILKQLGIKGQLFVGGLMGTVYAGQTVVTPEGNRFIWYADSQTVVFNMGGKVYQQDAGGFVNDVRTAPSIMAAKTALGMEVLGKIEIQFLEGLLAGASTVGFAIVIGTEVAEWIEKHKESFDKWSIQMGALLRAREILKTACPVTYNIIFNKAVKKSSIEVLRNLPDAIDAEAIAFAIGVISGHAGEAAAKAAFTKWVVFVTSFKQLLIRSFLKTPDAAQLAMHNAQEVALKTVTDFRTAGVDISNEDAKVMASELRNHQPEVKRAVDYLIEGFRDD